MSNRKPVIGIIGGAEATQAVADLAYETGRQVALKNCVLVCGGMGGVMEAASRGAAEAGGTVLGILPGHDAAEGNPYLSVAVPSGMGPGRNVLVVRSADVLIAFPGSYGTLSEMALALTMSKPVVYMPGCWDIARMGKVDRGLFKEAFDAQHALGLALDFIAGV